MAVFGFPYNNSIVPITYYLCKKCIVLLPPPHNNSIVLRQLVVGEKVPYFTTTRAIPVVGR